MVQNVCWFANIAFIGILSRTKLAIIDLAMSALAFDIEIVRCTWTLSFCADWNWVRLWDALRKCEMIQNIPTETNIAFILVICCAESAIGHQTLRAVPIDVDLVERTQTLRRRADGSWICFGDANTLWKFIEDVIWFADIAFVSFSNWTKFTITHFTCFATKIYDWAERTTFANTYVKILSFIWTAT